MMARMWRWIAFMLSLALFAGPLGASGSERVVTDPHSGLAIEGFDPVQYFLGGPNQGAPEFELEHEGTIWRFANAGNRAAFLAHPMVYAPRFGGHDPVAAARGFIARGDPRLHAIVEGRLYLFHTEGNLRAFLVGHGGLLPQAERNWARLAPRLAR